MTRFKVGDEVFADGTCGIVGDVTAVETDEEEGESVTVAWRPVTTTESADDLWFAHDIRAYYAQQ